MRTGNLIFDRHKTWLGGSLIYRAAMLNKVYSAYRGNDLRQMVNMCTSLEELFIILNDRIE